jgi:hypothetical protein
VIAAEECGTATPSAASCDVSAFLNDEIGPIRDQLAIKPHYRERRFDLFRWQKPRQKHTDR